MRKSILIMAVLALAMAAGTVYVVNNVLQSEKKTKVAKRKAPAKKTYVLVAASSMQPGQYVQANQVRWQVWPKGRISPTYITRTGNPGNKATAQVAKLRASVVRMPVASGQPITEGMIVSPGERGFLSAVLKPGMRAVSIPINAATGISGLAFPGDRVDLIWVYTLQGRKGGRRTATRVAETLLVGVKLLAIGRDLGHAGVPTDAKGKKNNKKRSGKVAGTATIELTPKQAEMMAVALTKGSITLSLNSLARPTGKKAHLITAANTDQTLKSGNNDGQPVRGRTFTMDQHVSRLISYAARQEPKTQKVVVVRGGKSEDAGSVKKSNKVKKSPDSDDDDESDEGGEN